MQAAKVIYGKGMKLLRGFTINQLIVLDAILFIVSFFVWPLFAVWAVVSALLLIRIMGKEGSEPVFGKKREERPDVWINPRFRVNDNENSS